MACHDWPAWTDHVWYEPAPCGPDDDPDVEIIDDDEPGDEAEADPPF